MFAEVGVDVNPVIDAPAPSDEPAAAPTQSKKEYKLKSGVTVLVDKLEVGGMVEVVAEDKSLAPAPAGEHELADGMTLVVDEAGVITEVKTPTDAAPEVEVEVAPAEPSEAELMKKKIAELEAQIEEMKKKQQMAEAGVNKFSTAVKELTDIVIDLMHTASTQPTEAPKDKFNKHVESYGDKVTRFLDLAKTLKK